MIPNAHKLNSNILELYTLEDFLNASECKKIIALIRSELKPSSLSSHEADQSFRTSRTCSLGEINNSFISKIDEKICQLIGIDPSYSESIQGQYYDVGQEFKAHTDYFEQHEMTEHGGIMGQRTYTAMIYLNDVEQGGETRFTQVNTQFTPKRGLIVIWNNLNPNGTTNANSMHHALPVLKSYKAVITKWFRSKSRLSEEPPMFV